MIRPIWFVVPIMTLCGTLLGAYHASQSVRAETYVGLIEAWPRLNDDVRAQVRHAMSDDELSQWEYAGLQASIMDSAGYMSWSIAENGPSVEDARARFASLVRSATDEANEVSSKAP